MCAMYIASFTDILREEGLKGVVKVEECRSILSIISFRIKVKYISK